MPDPDHKTVSASQVAALLDASPYLTRWLLWRNFKHGDETDPAENIRMTWGKRMQPVILDAVAAEMNLEVIHNTEDAYVRNPDLRMGCTLDGQTNDLNRGPGIVEVKNTDWMAWRDSWTATDAPDHIEIQIQAQMLVTGATWGVIACLVGGNDLRLYHREPDLELHQKMAAAVAEFFDSLDGPEPNALGDPMEIPLWRRTRDVPDEPEALDLTESRLASELLHELAYWQGMKGQATKMVDARKAKLEVLAGDHSPVRAWGRTAWLKRSQTKQSEVALPIEIRAPLAALFNRGGEQSVVCIHEPEHAALAAALAWSHITRRGGARVSITVKESPTVGEPPWAGDDDMVLHL